MNMQIENVFKPFKSVFDLIKAFPTEQSRIDYLEANRWAGNVISPFDSTSKVYKCTGNKYKCKNTGKYFNVRIGTIFEGSKISFKDWFMAIYFILSDKKGISSYDLADKLGITQKSAWFMLQRIRYALDNDTTLMKGTIQADETFVGGKNKNRHWDKKVEKSQGRSFKDKTPLVGLLNTDTKEVRCFVSKDTKEASLHPIVKGNVQEGSILMTDEWNGYNNLDSYKRSIVDHSRGQYVNESGATTNGMENFWSHFKRGWISTYSGRIEKKHLQKYADEFTFRYNHRSIAMNDKFTIFLTKTNGKRITYKTLTNNEK